MKRDGMHGPGDIPHAGPERVPQSRVGLNAARRNRAAAFELAKAQDGLRPPDTFCTSTPPLGGAQNSERFLSVRRGTIAPLLQRGGPELSAGQLGAFLTRHLASLVS